MSSTGEVEIPPVEKPAEEGPTVEQPQPAEKPVNEKKPKAPKEKKPRTAKTASHPPYFQMIKEAVLALNEKSGSSPYAIAKYMEEKHKAVLPSNFRKILGLQLKNSAAKGKLIKIKASYKLSVAPNKQKVNTKATKDAAAEKKTKPVKSAAGARNRKSEKEKKGAKPKKARKSAATKPKQPKSIKSPAARKARKSMGMA